MPRRLSWQWIPPTLVYAASALEMILMVTPFAAYFYSVYTPLLHGLTQFESTAWLSQFFLPHLARTPNLLFTVLEYLGPPLAVVGLLGFLICAGQLYYGKFVRKQLVSGWLYSRVRHPQYLCLAVAGLGFLLMWPRFIVLSAYLMMLGLYYWLARHEEEIIREKYGRDSARYMARVPMFNPFRAPSNAGPWQPPSPWKAFVAWAVLCVSGLGLAFLLRQEAVSQLHKLRWTGPNVTAISFEPRDSARLTAMVEAVLSAGPVRLYMNNAPDHDILLQIVTGGDQGRHLLTDLGMKAGAVQAAGLPEQGELVVLSRLIGPRVKNDPFDLNTRIEPVMLVYPSGVGGAVEARAFIPEQFYPDFARIMF